MQSEMWLQQRDISAKFQLFDAVELDDERDVQSQIQYLKSYHLVA